jgi:hypothetical protein
MIKRTLSGKWSIAPTSAPVDWTARIVRAMSRCLYFTWPLGIETSRADLRISRRAELKNDDARKAKIFKLKTLYESNVYQ